MLAPNTKSCSPAANVCLLAHHMLLACKVCWPCIVTACRQGRSEERKSCRIMGFQWLQELGSSLGMGRAWERGDRLLGLFWTTMSGAGGELCGFQPPQ